MIFSGSHQWHGVVKTRVRVRVRVGVREEGEGEFKGRVKAYGNITVPQLSIIRFS